MRSCIYGAGSLGTVLGAYISRSGAKIDLINRNVAHIHALQRNGATVEGTVSFNAPVVAYTPDQMTGEFDIILLLTKQQENAKTIKFLEPFLKSDGVLCTLQNGLPEPEIAEVLGDNRVLGCTVEWGATLISPGVSKLTSETNALSFVLGKIGDVPDCRLSQVESLLKIMAPVNISSNFIGARWTKLLINAAFSGPSAVLGCKFGDLVDYGPSQILVLRLIKECIEVSKAAGVRLNPIQGKDVRRLFDYSNFMTEFIAFWIIPRAMAKHKQLKASMLQDIEAGKITEVDDINGIICRYGQKYGVPTPCNQRVVDIIHEIEQKKLTADRGNLMDFESLIPKKLAVERFFSKFGMIITIAVGITFILTVIFLIE
jgi:2-dehydropantoate 2-reductase